MARTGRKYTAAASQDMIDAYRASATATAIADRVGAPWQSVVAVLKRHDVSIRGCATQFEVPAQTSPEFWRWLGYVMAEGCIERGKTTDKLWWVNSRPEIRGDFEQLTRELFGIEPKAHSNGKHVYIYSKRLGELLEALGLPVPLNAGNKRVPELLFRCTDEEIAAFLSAYLDGDGSVSKRQAELSAATKSEQLAHGLQILFGRLGVVAFCRPVQWTIPGKWTESRTYHQVTVSGDGLATLWGHLHFRHPIKQQPLDQQVERFLAGKQPSNWDVVPLPPSTFRAVRLGLGLTQSALGRPSSVNSIEHSHVRPTPRIARYFVNRFEQEDSEHRFDGSIAQLRTTVERGSSLGRPSRR